MIAVSNYPPGVTGNEWQIAGPTEERPTVVVCEEEDVTITVVATDGRQLTLHVPVCPFDGETDVSYYARERQTWWVCPVCGREHLEDVEPPEEDPDLQRDRMLDERWER